MYKFAIDFKSRLLDLGIPDIRANQIVDALTVDIDLLYHTLLITIVPTEIEHFKAIASECSHIKSMYRQVAKYAPTKTTLTRNLKQAYEVKTFTQMELAQLAFSEVAKIKTYRSTIQVAGALFRAFRCLEMLLKKYNAIVTTRIIDCEIYKVILDNITDSINRDVVLFCDEVNQTQSSEE